MPTVDWFKKWSLYSADKVAIKCADSGETLTYRELHNRGEKLACYLAAEKGLQAGDRIAVLAEFDLPYFLLFAALQKMGFILVPVNYRLAPREIAYMLKDSKPALFFFEEKFRDAASKAAREAEVESFEWSVLTEWSQAESADLSVSEPCFEDPAFILYTSGSTGFPKGALYTHKMMFWNSVNTALRLNVTEHDHTLMVMPPFHTGGWNVLTTPFLHFGASITLLPKFDADRVLHLLEEEGSTLFMAVPTMVRMLSDSPVFDKVKLDKLRYFIVGGEALPIPLIETWAEKEVLIRQGYGLTEVGTNVTSLAAEDAIRKQGSIGFPNFYLETRLVKEDGSDAAVNEIGELWLKGPVVTPGYWQNEEGTRKSFEGEWFKTGDLLRKDDEGYLYVVDRIKNMFISGGENVFPAEIEKYMITHPAIREVAVIGVPDERWGEVGKAVIASDAALTPAELKTFCEKGLAKFKVPKHFELMKELPKTDSGKIDKRALEK